MAKETKEKSSQELQIELLQAQMENLAGKVSKPQSQEEAYQARQALYDSKKAERDALKLVIDNRRMEIMMMPNLMGKAKLPDAIILESWERRANQLKEVDPEQSAKLMAQFNRRIYEIIRASN